MAKVLLINGSGNEHGCTFTALSEAARALNEEGVETEIIQLGKDAIRDCIGCGSCGKLGRCVFDDDQVNLVAAKAKEADGFIFGSPVYYAHPSGRVLSFLDRLFYSAGSAFAYKPGAAVLSARRGGTTASFDVLNKYFGISKYDDRWIPVLEYGTWQQAGGGASGSGGPADHAYYGPQYGLDDPVH